MMVDDTPDKAKVKKDSKGKGRGAEGVKPSGEQTTTSEGETEVQQDTLSNSRSFIEASGGPVATVELHEVEVQGFRCFGNESVVLSLAQMPGLVAVTGRNEADSKSESGEKELDILRSNSEVAYL